MLESIDFSKKHLSKDEYKPVHDSLIKELILLQQEANRRGVGLVVLFEGWNGAGKGSRISDLLFNLDARSTSVFVLPEKDLTENKPFAGAASGVTGFYPSQQEFWNALGPRGSITFYDRGWYAKSAEAAVMEAFSQVSSQIDTASVKKKPKNGKKTASGSSTEQALVNHAVNPLISEMANTEERNVGLLSRSLQSAANFERQLVDDGYLVVKFFLHVSADAQKKRLEKLKTDPATQWRVTEAKLASTKFYDSAYLFYDTLLEGSNFSYAPWVVLNGEDKREANLVIAQTLVDALKTRLNAAEDPAIAAAAAKAQANSAGKLGNQAQDLSPEEKMEAAQADADLAPALAPKHSRFIIKADYPRIDQIDHTLSLEWDDYKKQLKREQERLNRLEMEMFQRRIPMVIMYEGWDAAGKGGSIKRVAQALDARAYTIFTSPAPTKPELLHPFLWRYWTRLPKAGHVGIYDRSWYGRVLVERVEGFASTNEWTRAYDEINEFERELVRWGAILLKFWVDISPDEQLNRFHARQADPAKQWKITDEDWRNRDKYPQYKAAVEDMFRLTSTLHAPWHVLESDNKLHARVKALKVINDALEARLS